MNHIVLIGFMGSGKTSVGMHLAEALGLPFMDMDARITEREGIPITEIFKKHGEEYFRTLETRLLSELSKSGQQMVISSGGGMPVQPQNRSYLKSIGTVVFLQTSTDILVKRLQYDKTRPVLQGGDLRERITELKRQRNPIYEQVSDVQVVTDHKSIEEIVQEIKKLV